METATHPSLTGTKVGDVRPPPGPGAGRAQPGIGPGHLPGALRRRPGLWDRLSVRTLLILGLPLIGVLMLLAIADAGGLVVLWEPAHTTVAGFLATALALSGAHRSTGAERRIRQLVALGLASWTAGQIAWDAQIVLGIEGMPTASDVGYL